MNYQQKMSKSFCFYFIHFPKTSPNWRVPILKLYTFILHLYYENFSKKSFSGDFSSPTCLFQTPSPRLLTFSCFSNINRPLRLLVSLFYSRPQSALSIDCVIRYKQRQFILQIKLVYPKASVQHINSLYTGYISTSFLRYYPIEKRGNNDHDNSYYNNNNNNNNNNNDNNNVFSYVLPQGCIFELFDNSIDQIGQHHLFFLLASPLFFCMCFPPVMLFI